MILIYVLGYIVSYFFIKGNVSSETEPWTKEERVTALCLSIGSVVTLIAGVILIVALTYLKDRNKPVKW